MTPARRTLAAPAQPLADALAAEWRAQEEFIVPAAMPLTRLANSIRDGVAEKFEPVADEVAAYLGTDLVLYRAAAPQRLAARQAAAWDPVVEWAREAFGAQFVVAEGFVYVAQPDPALAAARAAIPRDAADARALWRLGALHSITTLTGSALIALALLRERLAIEAAWTAAHIDEDWNMEFWGRDEQALERRAYRFAEMAAAVRVLELLRG
jgi:chaperone required for assembly of F1-ATPase